MRTRLSTYVAGLTLLLAVLQIFWALFRAPDDLTVTLGLLLGLTSMVAGVSLARSNSFEGRLCVGLACGAQIGLMALAITVGMPGSSRRPVDLHVVVALVLPALLLALLDLDRRARRRRRPEEHSSYAL
ncbi:hypothetical protein [Nocardioides montaniterrae]